MAESKSGNPPHLRSCAFCEARCGIQVTADPVKREILRVEGDKDDPFSKGYICAKAYALTELHGDPDRLKQPLRRRGRDFEEIGWEEALDEAADRLKGIQNKYGQHSVGYYFGNPNAHKGPLLLYMGMLMEALGTMQVYSPGTLDQIPKWVSGMLMFGSPLVQPLADLDHTDHLILIGTNPVVAQGSMIVAPGFRSRIKEIRKRGGKVVVIDPRRTETAEIADEHISIIPGTDAYLLFAMIQVLFDEGLHQLGRAGGLVKNYAELQRLANRYPPERVQGVTGVPADTIRRLAWEMARAPTAAMHGRTGTCTQRFGTVTGWLIDALNILTGNLDRRGGSMFAAYGAVTPVLGNVKWENGIPPIGRWHARVSGLPESCGMLPTAALADEILTPGEGQVRGFVTQAGNPLLSNPHGARLAEAFDSLEFMLSLDVYMNETTRHADIIIPGPSYAEHADFNVVTHYEMLRKFVKWAPPIFDPPPGMPDDWEVFAGLAARLRGITAEQAEREYFEGMVTQALAAGRPECADVDLKTACAALDDTPGADRLFDALIRSGPYGDAFGRVPDGLTLAKVREHPHGLDLGPLTEELPGVLETPDGLIDLAPSMLVEDVGRMEAWIREADDSDKLILIGRRQTRSNNSWMHNLHLLVKGKERCTLLIHPNDAERCGLKTGDTARIGTDIGMIEAPVEVSDEIREGVVSLPHGWGHNKPNTRLRIASAKPGVNVNAIIDPMGLDVPTATTILNGVPVSVERVSA